jgi:hypothetical protein
MPAGMTYSSLVSDLENYLQRQDALVIAQIPRFIMLAQQRIPREMKLLGFRTEVQGLFDGNAASNGIVAKPSDWRQTIAMWVGTGAGNNTFSPVFERTLEYIRTTYPTPPAGIPRFYGDEDYQHWLVAPFPAINTPFRVAYYGVGALLDNTTQTNWLTQYAPDLLLYACLLEAIPFVKVDERIPVWQGLYTNAKTALQAQEVEGVYDTQAITFEPRPVSVAPK